VALQQEVLDLDPTSCCMGKVKHCIEELSTWSRSAFGHIQSELKRWSDKLKQTSDASERQAIFKEISDPRKKEEVYCWQYSRTNFLKFGD